MLGLLGVAIIVFTPSVTAPRLDAAAKGVFSDIELAKENAMTTGINSGVQFVASSNTYTAYQSSVSAPIEDPLTKQSLVKIISNTYPGISISNDYTVEFNSFGSPVIGGGGNVVITDGANTKTISVTANTGQISLQ